MVVIKPVGGTVPERQVRYFQAYPEYIRRRGTTAGGNCCKICNSSNGLSERDILTHAGKVSHEQAINKARIEYEKFRSLLADQPSPVEKHFFKAIKDVKKMEAGKKKKDTKNAANKG